MSVSYIACISRVYAHVISDQLAEARTSLPARSSPLCPFAHDPDRNRHRCGIAWSKSVVRVIRMNPRYTGRRVWNRQRKDEVLIDVADVALGHTAKMRWNEDGKWIYSEQIAHPPLISDEIFQQVQRMLTARRVLPAEHKPHRSKHDYVLRLKL